ncbi:flagellar biosynthetic protein FliR [Legionella israelensis]
MPQMNVYFLTVPVRILLGIVLLILLLQFFSPLLSNLFNQLFRHWQGIIQ